MIELVSNPYREQLELLHRQSARWGSEGDRRLPEVLALVEEFKTKSLLDYGSGKGGLAKALSFPIHEYDPGIPEKSATPEPADLVICTDVLEHVEPDKVEAVLQDLLRVTRVAGYFVINTGAAHVTLPDGRNAHLMQRDQWWWVAALRRYFTVERLTFHPPCIYAIVRLR